MAKGPTYRIPVDGEHKASLANKDALTGALWAGAAHPVLAAAFALGGGFWGKRHLKHQEEQGKVVKPPRFLNREFLLGGMIGGQAAVLPLIVAGFLGAGALVTAPLTVFAAAAVVPFIAVGAAIGAFKGKQKQAAAYKDAEAYVAANGEFNPETQSTSQAIGNMNQQQQAGSLDQARQQMNPDQLAQLQALAAQGQAMAPAQPETQAQKLQQHQHSQNQQAGR